MEKNNTPETFVPINTATETTVVQRLNQIIKYLVDSDTDKQLFATTPNSEVLYEIFMTPNGIFLRSGSYSFQLTAMPSKKWHADLRLSRSSLDKLDQYASSKGSTQVERPMEEIKRRFIKSLYSGKPPKPKEETKKKDEIIEPGMLALMHKLAEELNTHNTKKRIEIFTDIESRKYHIVLFTNNRRAGTLINALVQKFYSYKQSDENFHSRGGLLESLIKKLCEIIKCKEELNTVLEAVSPRAKIFIKHYSNGSHHFKFPSHTASVLIMERKQ